jgi:peptidoglycan-N-acetylglucosamine deacetylase
MHTNQQIFQNNPKKRKRIFRFVSSGFLLTIAIMASIIVIAFFTQKPVLPQIKKNTEFVQERISPAKENYFSKDDNEKYTGISNYIATNKVTDTASHANTIRAAFYVNWDASSLQSLVNHITQLNMVLPEWFWIDPIGDTLVAKIDANALAVMKHYPVKIVPILSNQNEKNGEENWDNDLLKKVLGNNIKRKRLINDIATQLNKLQLDGINIDFEEWDKTTATEVIQFQKELYTTLHANHKLVTQDVIPIAENKNATALSNYNDYIFVMAYNQHWSGSQAGDICEQRWIEKVLVQATGQIPSEKIVLCLAGFGYDWQEKKEGVVIKYAEALSTALTHNAKIDFDNDTYNSHFEYTDGDSNYHEVYFVDAAGIFNTMRLADEMEIGGTALWRLGSEDERMWQFYKKDLSRAGLIKTPFDFNSLCNVAFTQNTPTYVGKGEVLDVQSYPQAGKFNLEIDSTENLISEQKYSKLPTQYVIKKWGIVNNQVVLTFDDGPDANYTSQILDILEKEKVPATFFITGANAQDNLPLIKRMDKAGFEIGNHTFTHPNISTISSERTTLELKSTRLIIEAITGKSTVLFRAPYNADSEPTNVAEIIPLALSKKANYYTIGESIDPRDWEENITADTICNRIINQYEADPSKGFILLHDAGGNREATVLALPKIIAYFKKNNVSITTIGNVLGKTKDEIMPTVSSSFSGMHQAIAYTIFGVKNFISILFSFAFILGFVRIISIIIMSLLQRLKHKKEAKIIAKNSNKPQISIIVPAYNESVTILKTIENLLLQDYPNFNIIIIDDGSIDDTFFILENKYKNNGKVAIYRKLNSGKALSLNYGIGYCTSDFVVCIDADTILQNNAIAQMMQYFINDNIGAVAGNVKVGNVKNLLTNWQSIEYITAQNLDRRAFDLINGITIVPGAIGAFRKSAIIKAGGFTNDTLAEDCDLTIRINKCGYSIRNCNTAIAITEAPETLQQLLKQRLRWNYGVMQGFWKNKHACFNFKYKGLGLLGLPNILFFQILLPLISPIVDLLFLYSLFWQNSQMNNHSGLLFSYLLLLGVDIIFTAIAFTFEGESYKKLWYIIPQRIFYKPLMYIVIIKSLLRALKGESQQWGSITRTGNVNEHENFSIK